MRLKVQLNQIDMENILVDNRHAGHFSWLVCLISVVAPELIKKHKIKLKEHREEVKSNGTEKVRAFEFERNAEPYCP